MQTWLERWPRVLGVRLGSNPNSSALTIDVTVLMVGGVGALLLGFVASALLRGRRALRGRAAPTADGPGGQPPP